MKNIYLFATVILLIFALASCEYISAPIETGTDDSGVDGGIEWMYSLEAYPTYGIDRQRQKHYYTYDVTTEQIDEYMGALFTAGYTLSDAYGTAQSSNDRYPVGKYAGDEAYYVFTKGEESIILTYIYQDNGKWISEVDS